MREIKCEVCGKTAMKNLVICSEKCGEVRKHIFSIQNKFFPTHGCDNCWGDLYHGCSEQCKKERSESFKFGTDLWSLVRLIYSNETPDLLNEK